MDEIELVEYDPSWPEQFAEEAAKLFEALGHDRVMAIEHFGSTAIPGLAAKPIIDVLVGLRSWTAAEQIVPLLETLGYVYWQDDPRSDRLFFVKGMPPYGLRRTHHVHAVEIYSPFWQRLLLFRDYLRLHPEAARQYESLKRDLAVRFRTDREGYTTAKKAYIETIMAKARQEPL